MQAKSIGLIMLVCLILAGTAVGDTTTIRIGWCETGYQPAEAGYKIGLALSGGGARGLAQIGVLKAFEEADIRIGAIAGTSIGGIIGGLYASGYSADDLDSIIGDIDFNKLFTNKPARMSMFPTQREEMERYLISIRFDGFHPYIPSGLTAGQRLSDLLSRLTMKANYISGGDFNRLHIPYRAVTTDIVSGREKILARGNLADAMRATMAFPLAFTGVETGDMILMDGGMVDPIPVNVVRRLAPDLDLIVAVNTTSDLLPKDKINDPVDIANQVTSIMTIDKLETALREADLVISPDLSQYPGTDFDKADSLIELGYKAGKAIIPELEWVLDNSHETRLLHLVDICFETPGLEYEKHAFPLKTGTIISADSINILINCFFSDHQLLCLETNIIDLPSKPGQSDNVAVLVKMTPRPDMSRLSVIINGNHIFSDSLLAGLLSTEDNFLSAEDIESFSDSLVALYKYRGFDLAHVRRLTFDPENNTLNIDIDEAIIEAIKVTGNKRTKQWLIKANFPLNINRPFNSREARKGINNIFATDLFERVTMNIVPGDSGAIVRIAVEERKFTQLRLGWHWDDEYYSEQFLEILDDNLFGTGQEFLVHARYADRRQRYELSLKADRFFSTYLTYRTRAFYNILDRKIYNPDGETDSSFRENSYGFEFLLGHQLARLGTLTSGVRWENVENKYSPGGRIEKIKLRSLELNSRVETINRYPFPTGGKKHLFNLRYAADILGGQIEYTRIFSSIESYFSITDRINFHPRLAIGHIDAEHGLPDSEKFYLGGHYSFYGFQTDELVDGKMIQGNFELRFKLPYRFYLSSRYDLGQVYSTVDQIKLKNIRHGFGFSLAYDSPIGPIDFGYGKSGNHPDQFYIDIGLAF
nr:BamA/TamA family outer membrane protein [candidate division Zixibacteria bacterium]